MLALMVETQELATEIILKCKERSLILFWLLFEPRAIRITPPLTIETPDILKGCQTLLTVLEEISKRERS